jgi:hypothetical protein
MKKDWNKYIHQNKKGYGDCQLVTALNAYYHLTGKQYCAQDSKEYEKLVDLTGSRHGAAVSIEKAHKKLGIEIIWSGNTIHDLKEVLSYKKVPLPLEWNVWSWGHGFHSTLIVDYVHKCRCFRITNFNSETNPEGWMFEWDMYKYSNFSNQRGAELFRFFSLKGDPRNRSIKTQWKKQRREFFNIYKKFYSLQLKNL